MNRDLDLLTKYEPIICYTDGELFFPCCVEGYIEQCSLWMRTKQGVEKCVVPAGKLTVEALVEQSEIPGDHTLYMRFVQMALQPAEYREWRRQGKRFRAPGRLARVGLVSRLWDGFFDLSLAIRGTVPGGTAAKAAIQYESTESKYPERVYYGRVIRVGNYIVLHYFFFYVMNDWRSNFHGVNDHEADWEQVIVYLADDGSDDPRPLWVAYASHDYAGDNIRRRWDDPDLQIWHETHPVVYAGAGSHSSYFMPGEYLMGIEPRYVRSLRNLNLMIQNFWYATLGQGTRRQRLRAQESSNHETMGHALRHPNRDMYGAGHAINHTSHTASSQEGDALQSTPRQDSDATPAMLTIPYIDYARGDGERIGYGEETTWSPVLLTEAFDWVEYYRGLWGLDTNDVMSGERAPAGPKFNRDGSIRQSWYDPLGWVGLDKVTPPHLTEQSLTTHIQALEAEQETAKLKIGEQRQILRQAALETDALQHTEYLNPLHDAQRIAVEKEQQALQDLYSQYAELTESIAACRSYLRKVEVGDWGDPHAHLSRIHYPEPPTEKLTQFLELWAASSIGLLLLILAGILAYNRSQWFILALPVIGVFIAIEAAIRSQLINLLLSATVTLSILTALILLYEFFWPLIIGGLLLLVIYMLVDNLRELRST